MKLRTAATLILLAAPSHAATYSVSPSGGTTAAPWRTIAKAK